MTRGGDAQIYHRRASCTCRCRERRRAPVARGGQGRIRKDRQEPEAVRGLRRLGADHVRQLERAPPCLAMCMKCGAAGQRGPELTLGPRELLHLNRRCAKAHALRRAQRTRAQRRRRSRRRCVRRARIGQGRRAPAAESPDDRRERSAPADAPESPECRSPSLRCSIAQARNGVTNTHAGPSSGRAASARTLRGARTSSDMVEVDGPIERISLSGAAAWFWRSQPSHACTARSPHLTRRDGRPSAPRSRITHPRRSQSRPTTANPRGAGRARSPGGARRGSRRAASRCPASRAPAVAPWT